MLFTFSEQKIDILNLNHSPELLFLMRGNFYPWTWICSCVLFGLERVWSQDIAELLKYVKYVTGSLAIQK